MCVFSASEISGLIVSRRGRDFFGGAVSNGISWAFYAAQTAGAGEKILIRSTDQLSWATEGELIVATLVEFITNPGTLPAIFM
jgi:uncharacterized protein (DUF2062 family)